MGSAHGRVDKPAGYAPPSLEAPALWLLAREDAQISSGKPHKTPRAFELQVRYEMVQKLIMRMQKYHKRGVKIQNPPEYDGQSALDYNARFLDRK